MKRTFIIAEAGVNHNGSLKCALDLIDAAVDAGADAVKFQTFRADRLVTKTAKKAGYQAQAVGTAGSQHDMLKQLELDEAAHKTLADHCQLRGIEFMSTPFDLESASFLVDELGVKRLKVSSGDLTNAPLLLGVARAAIPLIISTGMATLGDIEVALGVIAFGLLQSGEVPSSRTFAAAYASEAGGALLAKAVTVLHCTTEYPAALEEVNLLAMGTLGSTFNVPIGYSDHTEGINVPVAAAALGATVIEKHFTLDKYMPGPDHRASLDPIELKAMVHAIRQVDCALGNSRKFPAASELSNRDVARKSLVAATAIKQGEAFSPQNVAVKRPGGGIAPLNYWDMLQHSATRDYLPDDPL